MKEAMRAKFYPDHQRRKKYSEFVHLTQGMLSVQEYKDRFDELARFALDLISTAQAKAHKFEEGLDFDILLAMGGGGFATC